jgi:hypothetical protein
MKVAYRLNEGGQFYLRTSPVSPRDVVPGAPVVVCKKAALMSILVLLTVPLLASAPIQASDAESGSVCEVLRHSREYLGHTFTFTGTFYHGVHGAYFLPEEKCGDDVAIRAVGSMPPATRGRASELVSAKGRIIVHQQQPGRMIGKPPEVVAFSVAQVKKATDRPVH